MLPPSRRAAQHATHSSQALPNSCSTLQKHRTAPVVNSRELNLRHQSPRAATQTLDLPGALGPACHWAPQITHTHTPRCLHTRLLTPPLYSMRLPQKLACHSSLGSCLCSQSWHGTCSLDHGAESALACCRATRPLVWLLLLLLLSTLFAALCLCNCCVQGVGRRQKTLVRRGDDGTVEHTACVLMPHV